MHRLLRLRHHSSSSFTTKFSLKPRENIHGFTLLESTQHPDSHLHLYHLEHDKTKAHFYHLERDDHNNCFAPIVKTLIDNNKGTPHILEHLVCCGSQLYPIRDPFMNMIRRSLNTYMNAWTGEDFTCYPFSSSNAKDFNNLLKVYSDMVFKANLEYLDFRQEGWRYEVGEKGVDYKGVVLNEMKGVYQSPERQLWLEINKNLLNGTPYSFDTGGDPSQIVNLKYNQLKDLFGKYYHPSNMGFYSYGNSDFTKTLEFLDNSYLSHYSNSNPNHDIGSPSPSVHQSTIYTKEEENQILFVYYLGKMEQIPNSELMALGLLSYLLFETNQSPMYEKLIEEGVGDAYTDSYGMAANKLVTFAFGLKGVQLKHAEFKSKIWQILQEVKEKGFEADMLEQAIIQTQISSIYPERNGGIKMLQKVLGAIAHRGDVSRLLSYKKELAEAKEKLGRHDYRVQLIDKYFFGNDNYTVVLQQSSDTVSESVVTPPKDLDVTEAQIKDEQDQLVRRQEDPVNKDVLPTLELTDINPHPPQYHLRTTSIRNRPIHHVQASSGLTHTKILFRLSDYLPVSLKNIMDVWSFCVNKGISTETKTYKQLSKQLALCSHGISAQYSIEGFTKQPYVLFNISCLDSTLKAGLDLMGEFLNSMRFEDGDNLKTLFRGYQSNFRNDVLESPIDYAVSTAVSLILEIPGHQGKLVQGLEAYKFTEDYLQNKTTSEGLQQITNNILKQPREYVFHSSQQSQIRSHAEQIDQHIVAPISQPSQFTSKRSLMPMKSLSFTGSYDINYCVASFRGPKGLTKEAAEVGIFLQLLEQKYLHKKIREQGGAYGSGAKAQHEVIYFYSYADPQSETTFKVFKDSITSLIQEEDTVTEEEIKQSKLSIFGRIDSEPVEYEKGMLEILSRVTPSSQQEYRELVRNADLKSIIQTGLKYLQQQPFNRIIFGKAVPPGFSEIKIDFDQHEKTLQSIKKELSK